MNYQPVKEVPIAPTESSANKHKLYADILRLMAMFAIITYHASNPLLKSYNSSDNFYWWAGMLIECILKWGTPIFIMLSGMFLLNPSRQETINSFLKRRASRILIPFFFWAIIYLLATDAPSIIANKSIPLTDFLHRFLTGQLYYHLWFVYMIFGLYLLTPILRVYLQNASDSNVQYYLSIWLLANILILFNSKFLNIDIKLVSYLELSGFSGYFVLGYYLNRIEVSQKVKNILYVISFISLLATVVGTYYLSRIAGAHDSFLTNRLRPVNIFTATSLFLFIKGINWNKYIRRESRLYQWLLHFSSLSFGIYLCHALVMTVFRAGYLGTEISEQKFFGHPINPFLGTGILTICTLVTCYVICSILKRIPIISTLTI